MHPQGTRTASTGLTLQALHNLWLPEAESAATCPPTGLLSIPQRNSADCTSLPKTGIHQRIKQAY